MSCLRRSSIRLALLRVLWPLALAACSATSSVEDGGAADTAEPPADGSSCAACDDGLFCNGTETCTAGRCAAGTRPCAAGESCDEATDRCLAGCAAAPDADGDGVDAVACGGTDCDDSDPAVSSAAAEVCDADDLDEDCDPTTFGDRDADSDAHVDAACCNGTACGDDCDDTRADVFAGTSETCNGRDDDCDGASDETLSTIPYYPDCDGDGYGDASVTPTVACAAPTGSTGCVGGAWIITGGDCDDRRAGVHPGVTDVCNGIDDDCNGVPDDPTMADPLCAATYSSAVHTTVVCRAGGCALAPCDTGYADCDVLVATGCEVDTSTDLDHCGTCATVCGRASTCTAGACAGLADIDAGSAHTCARYTTGRAVCWGRNSDGQLGDGTRTTRTRATPVLGDIAFTMVEAGGLRSETDLGLTDRAHTCGADATGVYCWGRGVEGQLGNNTAVSTSMPALVATLPASAPLDTGPPVIMAVSPGGDHTVYAQRRMRLGSPTYGLYEWGDGVVLPSQLSWGAEVWDLAAGMNHACLVNGTNGDVYCWGSNSYGELGVTGTTMSATPILATAWPTAAWADQITAGGVLGNGPTPSGWFMTNSAITCARDGGTVRCWGSNAEGQLGNGASGTGPVSGLTDAIDVAAGGRHACAVRATGAVVCWGHGLFGQLGNGGRASSSVPVPVTGITNAVDVTAGAEHSCAVLADGTARCWGRNDFGQLGDGTMTDRTTPVTVLGL